MSLTAKTEHLFLFVKTIFEDSVPISIENQIYKLFGFCIVETFAQLVE